jgi:flagellar hook protein FlgE
MGFQQGLSGLNVSAKSLDAIGNNIANSNTVGFKTSQVQFADVYAASLGGGGAGQIGIGASAPSIAQLFTQGNITTTNNPLDMAINGGGFYRLSDGGTPVYSRNGQFSLDKDGYMVNPGGLRVTGYGADDTGAIVPGDFVDLRLSTTNIEPSATTTSNVLVNLDSRESAPAAMTNGTLTGSSTPSATNITAANNTFSLRVDGNPVATAAAAIVDIPIASYSSVGSLATAVEAAINSHPTFAGANTLVDVSVNTSGALVISSRSVGKLGSLGSGSTVAAAAVTGDAGFTTLFGANPTATAGVDNFSSTNTLSYTGSTAQTVYDSLGNPHNLTMYFAKTANVNTWQLYTALDGTFTGNSVTSAPTQGLLTGTAFVPGAVADAGGTVTMSIDGVTQPVAVRNSLAAGAGTAYAGTLSSTSFVPNAQVDAGGSLVMSINGASRTVTIPPVAAAASSSGFLDGAPIADLTLYNAGGTIQVNIDGQGLKSITIPPPGVPPYTVAGLATAMQAAINAGYPPLVGSVTVAPDGLGSGLLVTSVSRGTGSAIAVADGSLTAAGLFGAATPVAGNGYDVTELATAFNTAINLAFGSPPAAAVASVAVAGTGLLVTSASLGSASSVTAAAGSLALADVFGPAAPTATAGGQGYSLAELASELQTGVDAAFGLGIATVSTSAGGLVVTSASAGGSSSVTVGTSAPLTLASSLFGATPTATAGLASTTSVVPSDTILSFDTTGALTTAMPLSLSFDPATGATNPLAFSLDFTGSSQYGINFGVNQLLQDGYTSGRLTGLSVSSDGTVQGRYSNGKTRNQGQVVLVNFNNANGLTSLGNNVWAETAESGQPIPGTPGQGSLGLIQSAAVEESNVDLTAELVNMITQQRVYQANAQTIKTQDQVLQTLVNLR